MRRKGRTALVILTLGLGWAVSTPALATAASASEVSETTRLSDRRTLVSGDRMYAMGDASGLYPAAGWHIRGEMQGFWTPPVKLLDGVWFKLGDSWLGAEAATQGYTRGHGYERYTYGSVDGVRVERVDFVPDGVRAAVIRLVLRSDRTRTLPLAFDAHSELIAAYPWGWTTPSAAAMNLQDTGAVEDGALVFRETGTPPVPNASAHDYAAVVGIVAAAHRSGARPGPSRPAGPGCDLPDRRTGTVPL